LVVFNKHRNREAKISTKKTEGKPKKGQLINGAGVQGWISRELNQASKAVSLATNLPRKISMDLISDPGEILDVQTRRGKRKEEYIDVIYKRSFIRKL